jgi:hypothetical protein
MPQKPTAFTLRTYRKYEKGGHHGGGGTPRMMQYAARCNVPADWLVARKSQSLQ